MKNLIAYSLLLFLFSMCSIQDSGTADNIKLVEKYIEAVEARNYETMELLLAEDYQGYGPSHSDSTDRADALSTWKHNIGNLYQDIKYSRSRNIAVEIPDGPNKGQWVSNWAELNIMYQDGRGPVTIWANTSYQIENGKISKAWW